MDELYLRRERQDCVGGKLGQWPHAESHVSHVQEADGAVTKRTVQWVSPDGHHEMSSMESPGLGWVQKHVHELGSGNRCACGFELVIPPVWCSIEVGVKGTIVVNMGFNCETVDGAIEALERAAAILVRRRDEFR